MFTILEFVVDPRVVTFVAIRSFFCLYCIQGVSKRCRLSWLTNSALVYEPKCGGWICGVSANEYSCAHGAQINFGDLTPYLTYDFILYSILGISRALSTVVNGFVELPYKYLLMRRRKKGIPS